MLPEQLGAIEQYIRAFLLLPFDRGVPGAVLETIHAHLHQAQVLKTYDFIDVIDAKQHIGWQIKSTKRSTPVTWKRAKIPAKEGLIADSQTGGPIGRKRLGDVIIHFCNEHARTSIQQYNLQHLMYARLIDHENNTFTYFERILPSDGYLFDPHAFEWHWSLQRTAKKEQRPAFHGTHLPTGRPWFAWHGLGENQLHFKGESSWWPQPGDSSRIDFRGPKQPLPLNNLLEILASYSD